MNGMNIETESNEHTVPFIESSRQMEYNYFLECMYALDENP